MCSLVNGSERSLKDALGLINAVRKNFFCETCRKHFDEYCRTNPPEKSSNIFLWSVGIHNKVNERLGKPIMTVEQANHLYYGDGAVCMDSGCRD